MWIVCKHGFFSIVYKPQDGPRLTIRARVRADLTALKRDYLPKLSKITADAGSDYRFRAFASRQDVARAIGQIVAEIDYPNFKDEVRREQGAKRAAVYHRAWDVFADLQWGPRQAVPMFGVNEPLDNGADGDDGYGEQIEWLGGIPQYVR